MEGETLSAPPLNLPLVMQGYHVLCSCLLLHYARRHRLISYLLSCRRPGILVLVNDADWELMV